MTSLPKPPRQRRRRIVVTIAVVGLLSLCSWWYWPRGDARFVGKWKMIDERGVDLGEVQLRSNGVFYGTCPPNTLWTLWSVTGDRFLIGTSRDPLGAGWLRRLSEAVSKGRNRKLVLGYGTRHRIESITPAEIQLIAEPNDYRIRLMRIPE